MATLATFRDNQDEFKLRASHRRLNAALEPECAWRASEITDAIASEHSMASEDIANLPGHLLLGEISGRLCKEWIQWLIERDGDGDYSFL